MNTHANPYRWLGLGAVGFMTLLSLGVGVYALLFQARVVGDPTFHIRFDTMPLASMAHVVGAGVVLIIGTFQFWPVLRRNYPALHRWSGRLYLTLVLFGGLGGLVLATEADGGLVARFGFAMLALIWLFSGAQAYLAIRRGDVRAHRDWMVRNFSLTLAAVTLRIYLGLFGVAGVAFSEAYPVVAWLSWVPNLVLVEWVFALRGANAQPPL